MASTPKPIPKSAVQARRQAELQHWFHSLLPELIEKVAPEHHVDIDRLSGDASFRRYFIGHPDERKFVLVDAPPDREDNHTFVNLAEKFMAAGINVPKVYAVDFERGFMCLSYLGSTLLWEKLNVLKSENRFSEVNNVHDTIFTVLLKIQQIREGRDVMLPPYDRKLLLDEMNLFTEWFCRRLMGIDLKDSDVDLLERHYEILIESAQTQQQVCVHRDFHSRNLIYQEDGSIGVLDFQDAVIGPITYDLVSLLKDCYISWPRAMIADWAIQYANLAQTHGVIDNFDEPVFLRSFDLMGVQRHLKAVGIFSRLFLRDGKPAYLQDIPRTLSYIKEVVGDDPAFSELAFWLQKKVYPMLATRLNAAIRSQRPS